MRLRTHSAISLLCVVTLPLIGCLAGMQNARDYSSFLNYASAANGATVEVSRENRLHPSHTLINGIKDSETWNGGEGWEAYFKGLLDSRIDNTRWSYGRYGMDRQDRGLGYSAMGWILIRFPEPERINRVVIYTIDSTDMPSRKYGVRDIWVQYAQPTGEWLTVDRTDKTKKQNKNLIYDNQSGVVVFNFKPVTTEKIRIAIRGTNDMKRYSNYGSSRGYRYNVEGTIRLLEIEAYGFGRATTTMVDTQELPGF